MPYANRRTTGLRRWSLSLLLVLVAGCGESAELSSPTAQRLRTLSAVYLNYAVAKGVGPANQQELRKQLRHAPGFLLQASGLSPANCESVLVSARDGEPFIIRYGVGVTCGGHAPPIAAEQIGKDGNRLVAFSDGRVACLEESAARELMQDETRSLTAEQPGATNASVVGRIQYASQ